MSAFGDLLESSKIVHPEEFGSSFFMVEASNQTVYLVGCSSQSLSKFCSHILCRSLYGELMTSSVSFQLKILLDVVTELISISLFSCSSQKFIGVKSENLIFVVFKGEDRSVYSSVTGNNNPILSANSEY